MLTMPNRTSANADTRLGRYYIYLTMTICPITALWPNGNIVTVMSCDISSAVGSILLCALIFAYNNNSSYTGEILSSVLFCLASLSSVQLSVTQH